MHMRVTTQMLLLVLLVACYCAALRLSGVLDSPVLLELVYE